MNPVLLIPLMALSIPMVAVGTPRALANAVPIKAPTIPITMVSQIGMPCLPGTMSRASAPTMSPMTMAVMMPVTVMTVLLLECNVCGWCSVRCGSFSAGRDGDS